MSADELRARFSELAERVVPMEDPHGRLMSRRRKRFQTRIASLATLTAAVVAGGVAAPSTLLSFGASPEFGPEVLVKSADPATGEEYVDRLMKAPVRGNLSGDSTMVADVQKAFSEIEPKYEGTKYEGATDPNLVFLNRADQMLQAVVIYAGGGQRFAVAYASPPNGSVKDLISDSIGVSFPVAPFLVLPFSAFEGKARSVVGLAPPGCAIEHSAKGGFAANGAWTRTYQPEPTEDYIVRDRAIVNELWRVSCGGRVREVRTADDYLDSAEVGDNAAAMYERVVGYSGSAPGKGMVQWRGRVPGLKSEVTLVSPRVLPGPAVLAVGPFPNAMLVTDLPAKTPMPVPTPTAGDAEWSMVALGVAGENVTVVRVPQMLDNRTVLGDRVLVYTASAADRVEALDARLKLVATAPVSQSVAILTFSPGVAIEIRAVTARGAPMSSVRFVELAEGSRVLGDRLFKDW